MRDGHDVRDGMEFTLVKMLKVTREYVVLGDFILLIAVILFIIM